MSATHEDLGDAVCGTAVHGDQSFDGFYAELRDRMVRMAYLSTRNHADAEDAVARAFAKVYPRWRAGSLDHPRAYLRTAVMNEVISGFRRQGRHPEAQLLDSDDHVEAGAAGGAEDRLAARDEMAAALAQVPQRQRTVLVLRYYEQLSEREIAELMGISTGTVKSAASRGLDRLRQIFEGASGTVPAKPQSVVSRAA
jgi:RNA polymerase sigma-70 factor (sigma-E family)